MRTWSGFEDDDFTVTADGASEAADGQYVSGNYFTGLGVRPMAGRILTAQDDAPGSAPVVVLTYRYWEKRFGLDPQVIGREVIINRTSATVIGVTPPAFQGLFPGHAIDLFVPMSMTPELSAYYSLTDPYDWWIQVFGRLRSGATEAAASAAAHAVLAHVIEDYTGPPGPNVEVPRIMVSPGARGVGLFRYFQKDSLYVLAALVAVVLLIACANLANLLLARGQVRRREIAVRLSIGASRGRLIRQLLTESLVLSCMAGMLGALLARPLLDVVLRMLSDRGSLSLDARVDSRALLFTLAVSVLTGVVFGILPAWRATRVDLNPALKDGEVAIARGGSRFGINRVLVGAQVAFSIMMLAGTALFVRTLFNLVSVDVGFPTGQLLTFQTDPVHNGYEKQRLADLYARMRANIESIPGVASVGLSNVGLLKGSGINAAFYMADDPSGNGAYFPPVLLRILSLDHAPSGVARTRLVH